MLKIADLLKVPSLGQSYIIAGYDGIFNTIKKLEIMEEPYPAVKEFLVPYGLLLTNFWSMKDDKEGRIDLVRSMIEKRCAGLGIMPGPHLNDLVDEEIIELGNRNSFPIIYIDANARWGNIISEYGVLSHSSMMPSFDSSLGEVLNTFSDFHDSNDVGQLCGELGRLLNLPLVMSTDTVFSCGNGNVSVALVVAKIQSVCQQSRNTLTSPISVRVNDDYLAIVYFGKRSMAATYIPNNMLNEPALQLFHKIVPTITKELDKLCSVSFYSRNSSAIANLGDTQMFFALVKRDNIQNVGKELNYRYLTYEQNTFFNYCILLIPDEFKKTNEVYQIYQQLIQKLQPDLFIFASMPMGKKEMLNEIEPLKYMVNSISYLEGIYSLDELPLLYILSYAPAEYKTRLFLNVNHTFKSREEDMVFLDTMRLYVVVRNMGDVANLLGIHANSVKYRLVKALKLMGYQEDTDLGGVPSVKLLMQLELIVINN